MRSLFLFWWLVWLPGCFSVSVAFLPVLVLWSPSLPSVPSKFYGRVAGWQEFGHNRAYQPGPKLKILGGQRRYPRYSRQWYAASLDYDKSCMQGAFWWELGKQETAHEFNLAWHSSLLLHTLDQTAGRSLLDPVALCTIVQRDFSKPMDVLIVRSISGWRILILEN